MAYNTIIGRVHSVRGNATTAEIKKGKVIVPPRSGKSIAVTNGHMVALGGNAGGATSVDIKDTNSSPVVAVALAVGGLTQNTKLDFRAGSNVTNTNLQVPLTADKGLQIQDTTANNLTTCTSVDYYVEYVYC